MAEITEYTPQIQEMFLKFLVSDPDLFARCQNIVQARHFDRQFRTAVDLMMSHTKDHNTMPTLEQINSVGALKLDIIPNVTPDHQNWFLDEFETFCRHKALEAAIISSTDDLENQNYGAVEEKIKEAVQIGLIKDL